MYLIGFCNIIFDLIANAETAYNSQNCISCNNKYNGYTPIQLRPSLIGKD